MRKILISIAAGAAALSAVPAAAQAWHPQPQLQRQIQRDINQLDNQISRATQRRTISRQEATGLRRQALSLQRSFNRFSRDGLNRYEVTQLENGINAVRRNLRLERRDWDNRRG